MPTGSPSAGRWIGPGAGGSPPRKSGFSRRRPAAATFAAAGAAMRYSVRSSTLVLPHVRHPPCSSSCASHLVPSLVRPRRRIVRRRRGVASGPRPAVPGPRPLPLAGGHPRAARAAVRRPGHAAGLRLQPGRGRALVRRRHAHRSRTAPPAGGRSPGRWDPTSTATWTPPPATRVRAALDARRRRTPPRRRPRSAA